MRLRSRRAVFPRPPSRTRRPAFRASQRPARGMRRPWSCRPRPSRSRKPGVCLEGKAPIHPNTDPRMGLFERKSSSPPAFPPSPSSVINAPAAPAHQPDATQTSSGPKALVISFANQKGGVAKTTTTLNLAVAFAEKGNRVLCVDLDPQSNLTMSQGIDPDSLELSMYDVLVNRVSIREVIRKREIDVACSSIDLAGAEIAMSTQIGR